MKLYSYGLHPITCFFYNRLKIEVQSMTHRCSCFCQVGDLGIQEGLIHLEEPTYVKPGPYWTGKQVVSTVLRNIVGDLPALTMSAKCKVCTEFQCMSCAHKMQMSTCTSEAFNPEYRLQSFIPIKHYNCHSFVYIVYLQ